MKIYILRLYLCTLEVRIEFNKDVQNYLRCIIMFHTTIVPLICARTISFYTTYFLIKIEAFCTNEARTRRNRIDFVWFYWKSILFNYKLYLFYFLFYRFKNKKIENFKNISWFSINDAVTNVLVLMYYIIYIKKNQLLRLNLFDKPILYTIWTVYNL